MSSGSHINKVILSMEANMTGTGWAKYKDSIREFLEVTPVKYWDGFWHIVRAIKGGKRKKLN